MTRVEGQVDTGISPLWMVQDEDGTCGFFQAEESKTAVERAVSDRNDTEHVEAHQLIGMCPVDNVEVWKCTSWIGSLWVQPVMIDHWAE